MPSPLPPYLKERHIALSAIAAASTLTRTLQLQRQSPSATPHRKADTSPVTVADYAAQALIVHRLRTAFPNDAFIAEETAAPLRANPPILHAVSAAADLPPSAVLAAIDACAYEGRDADKRTWILDPIDGTRGFIAFRQYCIALALLDGNDIQLAILGCPRLSLHSMLTPPPKNPLQSPHHHDPTTTGCIFHAIRTTGTYMTPDATIPPIPSQKPPPPTPPGIRITVSSVSDPLFATLCESHESRHSSHELSARIATLLSIRTPPVRMDSQAKYGCLARGDAAIFLRFPRPGYVENVWDVAPATLILEEAGGRVTDGRGRPLNFTLGRKMDNEDGIVASNGLFHDAIVAAVREAMREAREAEEAG